MHRRLLICVFIHLRLYEEILDSYRIVGIIDLSVGQGDMMLVAALRRMPYYGVVLSESHKQMVKDRVLTQLLERTTKESEDRTWREIEWVGL